MTVLARCMPQITHKPIFNQPPGLAVIIMSSSKLTKPTKAYETEEYHRLFFLFETDTPLLDTN